MSGLRQAVDDYLTTRRALGFKLADHGWLLVDLVGFLQRAGAGVLTSELALAWATSSSGSQTWYAARLSIARGFARYLTTLDPATEVPPAGLLCHRYQKAPPYLYSDADIDQLLAAASALDPPLRAVTYHTLIGLLACTGMRGGEATRLDRDDVDTDTGVLTVWLSKFGKSRQVPLHPSTAAALRAYARHRDQLCPHPKTASFFVSTRGCRLDLTVVHKTFRTLCQTVGLADPQRPHRPRMIDLRHTYAVRTLTGWYRAGVDVAAKLPRLSTVLGHIEPASTYWYLQ
ncbi:MAG: tyrosine-type recombinase/integrase, partial [Sporichthyaceae bacterium]|nr:tyrosine-type recombinase/integrase [Sporichthyaceae bacterium]